MPDITYSCDVVQGYNFNRDAQGRVGHINSLMIADAELAADFSVIDPEAVSGDPVKVVAIVRDFAWNGGAVDGLQFGMQISSENKIKIATLLHQTMSNTTVTVNFTVYDYDRDEKKFFKALHTDGTALNCLVQLEGDQLVLFLADDPDGEVEQPRNFSLQLGVMPDETQQEIHYAISISDKFVKQFGIDVSA